MIGNNEYGTQYESKSRASICLNGLWDFFPAPGEQQAEPGDGWGRIWVPGGWRNFIPWVPIPGIETRGAWQDFDPGTLERAWYRTHVRIPAEWAGRALFLELQRAIRADVFVSGVFCGSFGAERDRVESTAAAAPGCDIELLILAREGPGLFGDVFLRSMPAGIRIADVFVRTSWRAGELAVDVELEGAEGCETLFASARVLDVGGEEALAFSQHVSLECASAGGFTMRCQWQDPKLWDLGQPNLYTLLLELNCGRACDAVSQTFGFREFWIEGRNFFLNGTPIRLRPVVASEVGSHELIDGQIDGYVYAGFNIAEMWPAKEPDAVWAQWYDRADRKGFLVTGGIGNMWAFLNDWENPETRAAYERRTMLELRSIRNHPSIVMWGTNANVFGSGLGMDPRTIGVKKDRWYDHFYWRKRRVPIGEDGIGIIKQLDPTRPVFTHHGGGVGDVYTLNMYLNLTPLQEREEWLSRWAADSGMPFMAVEFGTPLHVSFMRGRTDFGGAILTEPWLTEFAAIYLGTEAYRMETDDYRRDVSGYFISNQTYRNWQTNPHLDFSPAMQAVQALFIRNTWRSWRTAGISGGMVPWNDGHGWEKAAHADDVIPLGPFKAGKRGWYLRESSKWDLFGKRPEGSVIHPGGRALIENNRETLLWIAGPQECFTAKDHNYFCGECMEKQLVLLNDTRCPQLYMVCWHAETEDGLLASGQYEGELAVGQTLFFPVQIPLPLNISGRRLSGRITLEGEIGGRKHRDTFAFTVFERQQPVCGTIAVHDPRGETTAMLRSLGYSVVEWSERERADLAVIGRCALSSGQPAPEDLEQFVAGGGRVILFAQDPQWMREYLGFRVAHNVSRRVFPVPGSHPAVQGLEEEDLRDWRGVSNLMDPYPEYTPKTCRLAKWWFPYHGYHWGNRGGVCSAPVEKPHRSAWRPLLECEFDLAYSPLMELDYGMGKLMLCTLDLEDHVDTDPAAQLITCQIVNSLCESAQECSNKSTVLLGCARDGAFLRELGVKYTSSDSPAPSASLTIVGPDADYDPDAVLRYLDRGGRMFFLPGRSRYPGFNVELATEACYKGSLDVPAWPECCGLSPSDLRFRAACPAVVIAGGVETGAGGLIGRLRAGDGTAIFCRINPEALQADRQTYMRFTRWRHMRALAQLLGNLGAEFHMDGRIFRPEREEMLPLHSGWEARLLRSGPVARSVKEAAAALARTRELPGDPSLLTDLPRTWENFPCEWEGSDADAVFIKTVQIPAQWQGRDL